MNIATDLVKATHIGIRELKEHLSRGNLDKLLVITDRGQPVSVNLPYEDILELLDLLDELSDPETIATIKKGRAAIKAGAKGIPVSKLFKKLIKKAG
ncbi:MAG: hypothetical protein KJ593_04990 [Candidatus Omnitrophica bacterium]|nr:hypothetical protein [Candidatus Omnitrophota bacterium]